MQSDRTMYVYEIRDNGEKVFVDIIVPGLDTLISLPLDEARRFAGDLEAEIGRYELSEESQPAPLTNAARKALNFVHREIEMNRRPPSRDEIALHLGTSRRSLAHNDIMKELREKGWYKPGAGHRDDDWGGSYKRPLAPPFASRNLPHKEFGQLQLAI